MRKDGRGYRIVGELTNTDRIMHDTFWVGVDYTAISMELKRLDLRAAHDRQLAQVMEQIGNECDK